MKQKEISKIGEYKDVIIYEDPYMDDKFLVGKKGSELHKPGLITVPTKEFQQAINELPYTCGNPFFRIEDDKDKIDNFKIEWILVPSNTNINKIHKIIDKVKNNN